MIVKNPYEVVSFIKGLPTVELKNEFLFLFEEFYTTECLELKDIVNFFLMSNMEVLTELGYLVEFD